MKTLFFLLLFIPSLIFAQGEKTTYKNNPTITSFVKSVDNLTLEAAIELAKKVTTKATGLDKKVTIAILDASGLTILIYRGDGVGPHNTEAARRKAFTALSTKTATLLLLRNAASNPDATNLNTLPELLLLSGGSPIYYKNNIIGSIGIAGGGSAENDDMLAKEAQITELGITTTK